MLKSLTVTNFALIENASIEFNAGLNILTGETGAGKSILIDALNVILGNRASVDTIRSGCDYFKVEALFDITQPEIIKPILDEQGISIEEDGTVLISRRYSRQGKNFILVNGNQTPVTVLRKLGEKLVDMHGQHDNQILLRPEAHLGLLDSLDSKIKKQLGEYRQVYNDWTSIAQKITLLKNQVRERAQRIDMLNWQIQEIEAAALKINEDEELERQIHILANGEKITNAANRAYMILSQGIKGSSGILPALSDVKRELEIVARYDSSIENQLSQITECLYQLEETGFDLRSYCDGIEFNPKQLSILQERMDLIYKLKKKYGTTVVEILAYYNEIKTESLELNSSDEHLTELNNQQQKLAIKLQELAKDLSLLRKNAANELSKEVSKHLANLGMPKAIFIIEVVHTKNYTANGGDNVLFSFSANPGEEPKALHKIASGGELSRIALAIKTVCAHKDFLECMVFDEVDTGIGGQTAQMVAEKIAMLAANKQVLCITHLPQIACMADCHIYIEKQVDAKRTHTIIKVLDKNEQLHELTRMISGNDITQLALDNAAQMLTTAYSKKEKWKKKA